MAEHVANGDNSEAPDGFRLEDCPQCGYSLRGLPGIHRCPECGFAYDDETFVLTGISRGTINMRPGRIIVWAVIGMAAWLGPMLLIQLVMTGGLIVAVMLAVTWLGLVTYLIMTGRSERRGVEQFIFFAGGFGYCADLTPTGVSCSRMISWEEVDTVLVDRKSAFWHRIRIGSGRGLVGRLRKTRFDAGVRCDEQSADWIRSVLARRIIVAREH